MGDVAVADGVCGLVGWRGFRGPGCRVVCRASHRVGQGGVGAAAVEVVGVAEGEGAVDVLGSGEDRVAGAPGAGAVGGRVVDEAGVREGLVCVAEVESGGGGGVEVGVEIGLQALLDDEEEA